VKALRRFTAYQMFTGGLHSNGRKTYGNSIIVEPWGNVISKSNGVDTGIIYATIDLDKVNAARKSIPISDHQRIFFNTSSLEKEKRLGLQY